MEAPQPAQDFRSNFRTHVYPIIGKVPVDAIDQTLVLKVVEPLWTTKTSKASRVLRQLAGILDWATAAGSVAATIRQDGAAF